LKPTPPGIKLIAQPLTATAFAPFGDLIDTRAVPPAGAQAINGGSARRVEALPDMNLTQHDGRAVLAVYHARARELPFAAHELERHRLSDQVFLPLAGARRCLVLVAPAGEPPQAAACRAFVSDGHQGLRLRAGTWHHGLLALDDGPWAVLERRARDSAADNDVHTLSEALLLCLA
jgi:ureidoglycolate lyase